jgi:putative ABC transport system substrate-binding protein
MELLPKDGADRGVKKEIGEMSEHRHPKWNRLPLVFAVLLVLLLAGCGSDKDQNGESGDYTIGIINLVPIMDDIVDGFKSQMVELGYVEGENLTYVYDGPAGSIDNLDSLAQELVEADVDLILSLSTPATQAVQRATAEKPIPCVFAPLQDPVGSGLVPSLREPGGNMTGVTSGLSEGKRLEWLTLAAPNVKRVYIIYNTDDPAPVAALELVSEAADQLGVELIPQPARNAEEVATAIENIPDDVDAIMIVPDAVVGQSIEDLVTASIERKLPFLATAGDLVADGALMSYGVETVSIGEQTARLADHILKGADPADMPVEVAEHFLTINLQTAEAIGLEIPDDVLRQADTIIRAEE